MLDGVRAVAALAVLLTHVAFQTGEVARSAGGAVLGRFDAGVAVFFVLSGFLLYRPHAVAVQTGSRPPALRQYALRRVARILPAYWVALAAVVLTAGSAPAGRVLTHLGLAQTYLGGMFPSYTQTWSLCTEIAFYAALPALAAAMSRAAGRHGLDAEWWLLGGLTAAGYGYIAAIHGVGLPDRALLWLPGHLDWFAGGMALAALWARGRRRATAAGRPAAVLRVARQLAEWPGSCWAAAGALLLLAATPIAGPLSLEPIPGLAALVKEALYAVIGTLLLLPAALGDPGRPGLGRVLASPAGRWLGRISYGVFLWHVLVLRWVYELMGWPAFGGHLVAAAVLTAAGSVAVAALSWAVVERPALSLAERLARRPGPAADRANQPAGADGRQARGGQPD